MISRREMYAVGCAVVVLCGLYIAYAWPRAGTRVERIPLPIDRQLVPNW